jgi:hypothetical protein
MNLENLRNSFFPLISVIGICILIFFASGKDYLLLFYLLFFMIFLVSVIYCIITKCCEDVDTIERPIEADAVFIGPTPPTTPKSSPVARQDMIYAKL